MIAMPCHFYTKLVSTNGHVSIMRTDDPNLPPYAVRLENRAGDKTAEAAQILDTFKTRAEADEFYTDALNRVRQGPTWPDPDQMSCNEIYPGGSIVTRIASQAT